MGTNHRSSDDTGKRHVTDHIAAIASAEIRLNAMIICSARDPFAMIELFKSVISDPLVDGGKVPRFYYDLAETALRCRAASQRYENDEARNQDRI